MSLPASPRAVRGKVTYRVGAARNQTTSRSSHSKKSRLVSVKAAPPPPPAHTVGWHFRPNAQRATSVPKSSAYDPIPKPNRTELVGSEPYLTLGRKKVYRPARLVPVEISWYAIHVTAKVVYFRPTWSRLTTRHANNWTRSLQNRSVARPRPVATAESNACGRDNAV